MTKRKTPYFFKEGRVTLWLTADQYTSLRSAMIQSIEDGKAPASRLEGLGPAPVR